LFTNKMKISFIVLLIERINTIVLLIPQKVQSTNSEHNKKKYGKRKIRVI